MKDGTSRKKRRSCQSLPRDAYRYIHARKSTYFKGRATLANKIAFYDTSLEVKRFTGDLVLVHP